MLASFLLPTAHWRFLTLNLPFNIVNLFAWFHVWEFQPTNFQLSQTNRHTLNLGLSLPPGDQEPQGSCPPCSFDSSAFIFREYLTHFVTHLYMCCMSVHSIVKCFLELVDAQQYNKMYLLFYLNWAAVFLVFPLL